MELAIAGHFSHLHGKPWPEIDEVNDMGIGEIPTSCKFHEDRNLGYGVICWIALAVSRKASHDSNHFTVHGHIVLLHRDL